jgi:hypothetical protein
MNNNIQKFKKYVVEHNLKKKSKNWNKGNLSQKGSLKNKFEIIEKNRIQNLTDIKLKELKTSNRKTENLAGIEISLGGRIKGAAKARRTTTGLSGSLKPQTILGSEFYSIYQKNVYSKWGTLGLTIRTNNKITSK